MVRVIMRLVLLLMVLYSFTSTVINQVNKIPQIEPDECVPIELMELDGKIW